MLRPIPSSIHATANTPADPVGARVARFPTVGSLPRFNGGSASALRVSRPARRSLALWPVWSLSRPRRPSVIGVLQTMLLPPPSAPTATGWSDSCRAGFAPAEDWRLFTAHVEIHAKDSDRYKVAKCIQAEPVFCGFGRSAHSKVISVSVLRASRLELGGVDLDLAVEDDVLPLDRADMTQ